MTHAGPKQSEANLRQTLTMPAHLAPPQANACFRETVENHNFVSLISRNDSTEGPVLFDIRFRRRRTWWCFSIA